MKWCIIALMCMFTTLPAYAQDRFIQLPMFLTCSTKSPVPMLQGQHGELPLLQGDGKIFIPGGQQVGGKMQMLMNPDNGSFTILFLLGNKPEITYCLVMSGQGGEPIAYRGDPL